MMEEKCFRLNLRWITSVASAVADAENYKQKYLSKSIKTLQIKPIIPSLLANPIKCKASIIVRISALYSKLQTKTTLHSTNIMQTNQ